MKPSRDSTLVPLPPGRRVQDVLPQFLDVRDEIAVGTPAAHCAGCSKPFTIARKRKMRLRLYPIHCPVPMAFAYCLCGACAAKYRRGGAERETVLRAVEAFHQGGEAA